MKLIAQCIETCCKAGSPCIYTFSWYLYIDIGYQPRISEKRLFGIVDEAIIGAITESWQMQRMTNIIWSFFDALVLTTWNANLLVFISGDWSQSIGFLSYFYNLKFKKTVTPEKYWMYLISINVEKLLKIHLCFSFLVRSEVCTPDL